MAFLGKNKRKSRTQKEQEYLAEIHAREKVRLTYILCEVIDFINWVMQTAIFAFLAWNIAHLSDGSALDLEEVIYGILWANNSYILIAALLIVAFVFQLVERKAKAKLQAFEDAGLAEIEAAVKEGTYRPTGAKESTFNKVRKIIQILIIFAILGYMAVSVWQLL